MRVSQFSYTAAQARQCVQQNSNTVDRLSRAEYGQPFTETRLRAYQEAHRGDVTEGLEVLYAVLGAH